MRHLCVRVPACILSVLTVLLWIAGQSSEGSRSQFSEPQIELMIQSSDDYAKHRSRFMEATEKLLRSGRCEPHDFSETGGWVKSATHKNQPVYFTFCGGVSLQHRVYLNVESGNIFPTRSRLASTQQKSAPTSAPTSAPKYGGVILLVVLIGAGGIIYFIPALLAKNNNHKDLNSIFVVNLFLGWTLIGWVVALAWAVKSNKS